MGIKIHDNEFVFNIEGLSDVSFTEKDHCISHGQPYEGVTCHGKTLVVKAGRHKTSDVSHWFMNNAHGGGVIAKTFNDHQPAELNFAVRGKLTLTVNGTKYTIDDFLIGQGSYASHNNWWIGSKDMIGVTWGGTVDLKYAEGLAKDTLNIVKNVVTENPVGAITASGQLILDILKHNKVGSGSIAALISGSNTTVELFLFQMDNSDTKSSMTGKYTAP